MPRDPTKHTVHCDFPSLPYAVATRALLTLGGAERECGLAFVTEFKVFVLVWEYGYFFLDAFIRGSTMSRGPIASSLRRCSARRTIL
jgi:hypothetical protein